MAGAVGQDEQRAVSDERRGTRSNAADRRAYAGRASGAAKRRVPAAEGLAGTRAQGPGRQAVVARMYLGIH
jgi:hypothetical protein